MKQSEWLYGKNFKPKKLSYMFYREALVYKINCAKYLLEILFKEPYAVNNDRINDISKSIKFNEALLAECKGVQE